jgi:hypothetical protein
MLLGKKLLKAVDAAGEFVQERSGEWTYQDAWNLMAETQQHVYADQLRCIADELDRRNAGGEIVFIDDIEVDEGDEFPLGAC